MPIHDYQCDECDVEYEVMIPLSKTDDKIYCPECGKEMKKQLASPYFVIN